MIKIVERDYPNTYAKFTSLGPALEQLGNGSKGLNWDVKTEVKQLGDLNYRVTEPGVSEGRPRISTAIHASETILMLAPETNGHVAVKGWQALSEFTGREHAHLAKSSEHEKFASKTSWRNRAKSFQARRGRGLNPMK